MTEAEIPPFKDQCLKWHNVYREKHQVNNNRIDFSLRVNCISMQVAVIVSMNQLHDPLRLIGISITREVWRPPGMPQSYFEA